MEDIATAAAIVATARTACNWPHRWNWAARLANWVERCPGGWRRVGQRGYWRPWR